MSEPIEYTLMAFAPGDTIIRVHCGDDEIMIPAKGGYARVHPDGTSYCILEILTEIVESGSWINVLDDMMSREMKFDVEISYGRRKWNESECPTAVLMRNMFIDYMEYDVCNENHPNIKRYYIKNDPYEFDWSDFVKRVHLYRDGVDYSDALFRIARALENIKRNMSGLTDSFNDVLDLFYSSSDMELTVDEFAQVKQYGKLPDRYKE